MKCPVCGKPEDKKHEPFCSPRCKQVDLGRWFNESYVIPGSEIPTDEPLPEQGVEDEE